MNPKNIVPYSTTTCLIWANALGLGFSCKYQYCCQISLNHIFVISQFYWLTEDVF
uniref:Uncharacterized protein n=1 Tax=Anguilla anguilla TaxID=7936 RepID=A0A0E9RXC1_ANGAN